MPQRTGSCTGRRPPRRMSTWPRCGAASSHAVPRGRVRSLLSCCSDVGLQQGTLRQLCWRGFEISRIAGATRWLDRVYLSGLQW